MARESESSRVANATQRLSGLHDGASVRCGTIHGSRPTIFAVPLAMSSTQTLRFVSL